jgi:hypothetical protein
VESTSGRVVQAALEYASFGWRVVPLHGVLPDGACTCGNRDGCEKGTRNRGKHPRIKKWQTLATSNEDTIGEWFSRWPDSNVGVQMGQTSGIIDFETDSAQGEAELTILCGGRIPVTPTFTSGRGKHRLFKWRGDLPLKASIPLGWGDVKLGNGEREGSQSVFPPSRHASGKDYRWLITPDQSPPSEIPDQLFAFFHNVDPQTDRRNGKTVDAWQRLAAGSAEGMRNASMTQLIGGLLRQWHDLETPASVELLFQSVAGLNRSNKPPLDDAELKNTFTSILKMEINRRSQEAADSVLSRSVEERIAEATKQGIKTPEGMRLEKLDDDPPVFLLYGSQFKKARGGCLRLTGADLFNFRALQIKAAEQADCSLNSEFSKAWAKRGGIREQLLFTVETIEVSPVTKRLATAAGYLLGKLDQAVAVKDDGAPDRTLPTLMTDGTIWFRWNEIWRDGLLSGMIHKEAPGRLSHALKLGPRAQQRWPHRGSGRSRYTVFDKGLMEKLEELAEYRSDVAPAI